MNTAIGVARWLDYGATMSSDNGDPGITTDELPALVASDSVRVLGDVFHGRARSVVMSESQRASRSERDGDDPTVIPERFTRPHIEPDDGTGPQTRPRPARIISVVLAIVFAVPATLVVALMIALAVR